MTLELDVGADGEDGEGGKDVLVTSNATQKITEVSHNLQASSDSKSSSARARGVAQVSLILINIQGGPSALGKNYVDTKFEVAFSCKFSL